MNRDLAYNYFLTSTVYLLLFCQVMVNTASYCHWMLDSDSEHIEFFIFADTDAEEEENKKEKDDTIHMGLHIPSFFLSTAISKASSLNDYLSKLYSEVLTPPPEYFSLLTVA